MAAGSRRNAQQQCHHRSRSRHLGTGAGTGTGTGPGPGQVVVTVVRDQSPVNRVQLFRNVYRWYVYHSQSVMYEVCVRGSYLSKSINTAAAPRTRDAPRANQRFIYLLSNYNYIAPSARTGL